MSAEVKEGVGLNGIVQGKQAAAPFELEDGQEKSFYSDGVDAIGVGGKVRDDDSVVLLQVLFEGWKWAVLGNLTKFVKNRNVASSSGLVVSQVDVLKESEGTAEEDAVAVGRAAIS